MIGLQTSLDLILAAVTQTGAPGVMPLGSPIHPIREGPRCPELAPVSTLNMIQPHAGPAPPSAAHFPSARLYLTGWSTILSHTHIYLSPTSMVPMRSSPVPLPRLKMNLEKPFRDRPSTPPSKHYKGLRMQQRRQRLLPRYLHPGSCDITVKILTASQGREAKET
jgi:hypothetical protein